MLDGEKTLEERPVLPQRLPQVFRRYLLAAIPLFLERRALVREDFGEALDDLSHQRIRLFDSLAWLVDESGLHRVPASAIPGGFLARKHRDDRSLRRLREIACRQVVAHDALLTAAAAPDRSSSKRARKCTMA